MNRVHHQEPGTPLVSGDFESPTMASTEARSDPARGSAHIHTMSARVRDSPTMASPEARSDPVRGTAQDRGVGAGIMLSPQRETSGHKAGPSASDSHCREDSVLWRHN